MNHQESFPSENESANEREIQIEPLCFVVAIRGQQDDRSSISIDVYLQGSDTILESLLHAEIGLDRAKKALALNY